MYQYVSTHIDTQSLSSSPQHLHLAHLHVLCAEQGSKAAWLRGERDAAELVGEHARGRGLGLRWDIVLGLGLGGLRGLGKVEEATGLKWGVGLCKHRDQVYGGSHRIVGTRVTRRFQR